MKSKITYTPNFKKTYKKRIKPYPKLVKKFYDRLEIFINDRNNIVLRDHILKGNMFPLRSFSVTGDIRVVYAFVDNEFHFVDIGTHAQVYAQ